MTFRKNKVDLTQNFFSPFASKSYHKLYEKGKISEAQYLNSVSLSFGIFTAINEKANRSIEENILTLSEDRDNIIEYVNSLDKMTPEEREKAAYEQVGLFAYGMKIDSCKTAMELKKVLYFTELGLLYSCLESVFSPDTVNDPVSGMDDDILEEVYLAATLKEAIDFVNNDPEIFDKTSVFETKGLSLDERGEYIKRGENPPEDEIIITNTYTDFITKESLKNSWEIAKRMRDILVAGGDGYEDPKFFDQNGFILTEDGFPIERRLEAHYRGMFLRKLVDTKGYEKQFTIDSMMDSFRESIKDYIE